MDWTTILWIVGVIVFLVIMMRGCGGMMAGRECGMGSHRQTRPRGQPEERDDHGAPPARRSA